MTKDIYFNQNYCRLYEEVENGILETFEMDSIYGKIEHIFIKREIQSDTINGYYDIITPYGYGGPLVIETSNKDELIKEYSRRFSDYCLSNHIVSEFVRFHPIYQNALDFSSVYHSEYSRHTIGTNLKDYDDPVQAEFAKSLRRELRKAEAAGVTHRILRNPSELTEFKKLYEETMNRNQAEKYYYFDDSYWNDIMNNLGEYLLEIQLLYQDSVIASELYFIQGKYMHAHLLGGSSAMLELNAGVMLEATAARWGHENGYEYIHHGGGRTSADDDSLYLYKMKYGKNTKFDFYVGRKVWNDGIYKKLVEEKIKKDGGVVNNSFFPLYRSK